MGVAALLCVPLLSLACGGSGNDGVERRSPSGGSGSGPSTGSGSGGAGSGSGAGPSTGSGGTIDVNPAGGTSGAGGGMGCFQYDITVEPKTPTVYILVDRSSSMKTYGLWSPIRDAILPVVEQLQSEVRFGFSAYTGKKGQVGCPGDALELNSVPIDLNNYAAIEAVYGPLEPPDSSDTPTGPALDFVREQLLADTVPGDKFVLLVTDGQPDFCDDPDATCPTDAVVRKIQELRELGIPTMVFGFEGIDNSNPQEVASLTWALESFANAGAGQPVGVQPGMTRVQMPQAEDLTPGAVEFWDKCSSYPPWKQLHEAAGLPEWHPLGVYGAPAGTAKVFKPNPADQAALAEEFSAALAGVKSCTFDLSAQIADGTIAIDLKQVDKIGVWIEGNAIPLDPANGWHMPNETQLVLEGAACETWRLKKSKNIAFDFPCEIVIVVPK